MERELFFPGFEFPPLSAVSALSYRQLRVLAILPSVTAPFSVISAALILVGIQRRRLYKNVYGRLMSGVSVYIIVSMSVWSFGPVPVVQEINSEFAHGTTQSCSAAGFLTVGAIVGALQYYLCLMLYFFVTVCLGVKEETITKKVEIWFHVVANVSGLTLGVWGLVTTSFNPAGNGLMHCLVGSYPPPCRDLDSIPCERGEKAGRQLWFFISAAGLLSTACYTCVLFVYLAARKRLREAQERFGSFSTFRNFKAVERQTVLYAIFILLTQGLLIVMPLLEQVSDIQKHEHRLFPVQVLFEILFPLQGLIVFLIFCLPRYSEIAARHPNMPRRLVLQTAIFSRQASNAVSFSSRQSRTMNHPVAADESATRNTSHVSNGVAAVEMSPESRSESSSIDVQNEAN